MTQQIIKRWSQIRGLDEFHAMLELRFLGDILASNKKEASVPTETIADTAIISQKEPDAYADQNQICIEV